MTRRPISHGGITDSLSSTDSGIALSAKAGNELNKELTALKNSVADSKSKVVAALKAKGVSISNDATWAQIVTAINGMTLDVKHTVTVFGGVQSRKGDWDNNGIGINCLVRLSMDGQQKWEGLYSVPESTTGQSSTTYTTTV